MFGNIIYKYIHWWNIFPNLILASNPLKWNRTNQNPPKWNKTKKKGANVINKYVDYIASSTYNLVIETIKGPPSLVLKKIWQLCLKSLVKVILHNCIAHPNCAEFCAWLAHAHKQNSSFSYRGWLARKTSRLFSRKGGQGPIYFFSLLERSDDLPSFQKI